MKKLLSITANLLAILVFILCLTGCGDEKNTTNEIPDVFGLNYTDAISILEADGFEVSTAEANVDSFSDKLLYPLEKVYKGTVFKIDEYIIDNLGNLNKNYDVFYDEGLVSADKSVVIYYAKEDYVLEMDDTSKETTPSTQANIDPSIEDGAIIEEAPVQEETPVEEAPTETSSGIRPEFKEAMDSYEAFYDEYCAFMEKYSKNPTDLSLLGQYAGMMSKSTEMTQSFDAWNSEDLNDAELAYYLEVNNRVAQKLLACAQ